MSHNIFSRFYHNRNYVLVGFLTCLTFPTLPRGQQGTTNAFALRVLAILIGELFLVLVSSEVYHG